MTTTMPTWKRNQLEDAMEDLENWLETDDRFDHLHIKKRGSALTLYSTTDGKVDHARLTIVDRDFWGLSLPNHSGRWEKTPFAGTLRDVYESLTGMLDFHLSER